MIESTIISWIGSATAAGSRVSVGARLQSTTLPALVIDLTEGSAAALPSTTRNLYQYSLSMSSVADTMLAAQSLSDAAVALVKTGALTNGGWTASTNGGFMIELPSLLPTLPLCTSTLWRASAADAGTTTPDDVPRWQHLRSRRK